ncbi:hypothetical protein A1OE_836 [Candidatus Endolissoclinum faulkneri L2]|uniref:Uncharacterized protein n=1 Tax=Candidatus Endolissoclinum faulkneri L2 TaxID=1193729 RepID=K7ZCZ3_9PROT|nr:hypothetical protein A1OE_836 [Candidatus Endolissoclinum faulkneri L2]
MVNFLRSSMQKLFTAVVGYFNFLQTILFPCLPFAQAINKFY